MELRRSSLEGVRGRALGGLGGGAALVLGTRAGCAYLTVGAFPGTYLPREVPWMYRWPLGAAAAAAAPLLRAPMLLRLAKLAALSLLRSASSEGSPPEPEPEAESDRGLSVAVHPPPRLRDETLLGAAQRGLSSAAEAAEPVGEAGATPRAQARREEALPLSLRSRLRRLGPSLRLRCSGDAPTADAPREKLPVGLGLPRACRWLKRCGRLGLGGSE